MQRTSGRARRERVQRENTLRVELSPAANVLLDSLRQRRGSRPVQLPMRDRTFHDWRRKEEREIAEDVLDGFRVSVVEFAEELLEEDADVRA